MDPTGIHYMKKLDGNQLQKSAAESGLRSHGGQRHELQKVCRRETVLRFTQWEQDC